MSFQIAIKPHRRAATRFIGRVRRALQEAFVQERERRDLTQIEIAAALDVDRSVITRQLRGDRDMTIGRVAELAWAMGRDIEFQLVEPRAAAGQNIPQRPVPIVVNQEPRRDVPIGYIQNRSSTKPRSFHMETAL